MLQSDIGVGAQAVADPRHAAGTGARVQAHVPIDG